MTLILTLFVVATILFAVELLIPGGILGVLGVCVIVTACIFACVSYGAWLGGVAILAGLSLCGILLYLEFLILPKTKFGRRARLDAQVTGVATALGNVQYLIGLPAEAVTMLSPSGYVTVEGQRFEAFCENGQTPVGAPLLVVGADNFRLIVTKNLTF